jgi:hypothetical protein
MIPEIIPPKPEPLFSFLTFAIFLIFNSFNNLFFVVKNFVEEQIYIFSLNKKTFFTFILIILTLQKKSCFFCFALKLKTSVKSSFLEKKHIVLRLIGIMFQHFLKNNYN